MSQFSNQKCPVCKMVLKEERDYLKAFGEEFCSQECLEEYRKKLEKKQTESHGCGCHIHEGRNS